MFQWIVTKGQIEQSSLGKSLARKEVLSQSYEDQMSTWNSGVGKASRRGSAEEEVRKNRDLVTGVWKQISK